MNTLMITAATNAENKAEEQKKASLVIKVEVSKDDVRARQLCRGIMLADYCRGIMLAD